MYVRTTWISVQNFSFKSPVCNSFLNKHVTFTDKTAAVNSSLGTDTNFFGETLEFPINKLKWSNPNQVVGDILEFVSFQLVSASSPTLSIDFSALHQQSHPIAHFILYRC